MARRRITLEVEVWQSREPNGGFHATLGDIGVQDYKSADDARRKLAAQVRRRLKTTDEAERNGRRHLLGCGDGTVLLVCYVGAWGYYIGGTSRKRASSAWQVRGSTEESALEQARTHAEQCFGGVSWETVIP